VKESRLALSGCGKRVNKLEPKIADVFTFAGLSETEGKLPNSCLGSKHMGRTVKLSEKILILHCYNDIIG
jgi:hypothetical protein